MNNPRKEGTFICPVKKCPRHIREFKVYKDFLDHYMAKHATSAEKTYYHNKLNYLLLKKKYGKMLQERTRKGDDEDDDTDTRMENFIIDDNYRVSDVCPWDGCLTVILRKDDGYGPKDIEKIQEHLKLHKKYFAEHEERKDGKNRRRRMMVNQIGTHTYKQEHTRKPTEETEENDETKLMATAWKMNKRLRDPAEEIKMDDVRKMKRFLFLYTGRFTHEKFNRAIKRFEGYYNRKPWVTFGDALDIMHEIVAEETYKLQREYEMAGIMPYLARKKATYKMMKKYQID